MPKLLEKFESYKSFTAVEAWKIFRIAALSEAFGWTLLISALIVNHYKLPGNTYAIPIAGQIHGTIFIVYFLCLVFIYPSLNWSRKKTLIAFLAGIPPYGTLIFEIIASKQRKSALTKRDRVYIVIRHKNKILAAQPSHGIEWVLPGIDLLDKSPPLNVLRSWLKANLGINEKLYLMYSTRQDHASNYYYGLDRPIKISGTKLLQLSKMNNFIDEYGYVDLKYFPEIVNYLSLNK